VVGNDGRVCWHFALLQAIAISPFQFLPWDLQRSNYFRFTPESVRPLWGEHTLIRGAYRSSSTPRIIGTHVPPIWVAVTLPALLSALAMSRLGRPISMP